MLQSACELGAAFIEFQSLASRELNCLDIPSQWSNSKAGEACEQAGQGPSEWVLLPLDTDAREVMCPGRQKQGVQSCGLLCFLSFSMAALANNAT